MSRSWAYVVRGRKKDIKPRYKSPTALAYYEDIIPQSEVSGPTVVDDYFSMLLELDKQYFTTAGYIRWKTREEIIMRSRPRENCRSVLIHMSFWDGDIIKAEDEVIFRSSLGSYLKNYSNTPRYSLSLKSQVNSNIWRSCLLIARYTDDTLLKSVVDAMGELHFRKRIYVFLAKQSVGDSMQVSATFENTWCALNCFLGYAYNQFGTSSFKSWTVSFMEWI